MNYDYIEGEEKLGEIGRAALWYVRHGLAVFPCIPRTKYPAVKNGFKEWTTEPRHIVNHWSAHPNDNIGITCGTPSHGLVIIDLDVKDNGVDGRRTLREWEAVNGELPETPCVTTGGGGKHLYFITGRTLHPTVNDELGVDTRTDGSFVIAPPSIHNNGAQYEWDWAPWEDGAEIAEADDSVFDFIDYVTRNGGHESDVETRKENGKFKLPDEIKEGRRDRTLFEYACHLRSIGRSDEEIMTTVTGANMMRCKPPMEAKEIERICKSACNYDRGTSETSDREIGAPGKNSEAIAGMRGPRGGLRTNVVARHIIDNSLARIIDGAPAVWTGKRHEFGQRAINRCVLALADDAKKNDKAEVFSYIMDQAPQASSESSFDGGYYVQFQNCTYNVMRGEMVEPSPEMFVTNTIAVDLNLDVGRNEADEFLDSVSGGDSDTRQALIEIIGASMCCRRVISQSPMLIGRAGGASGKASNGKSTFLNWLRSILGTQNVSSLDIATLGQRFQAGRVVGKLANLGDDIPDGFLRGEELSIFKKLVTGDAIYTDVKNSEGYEFRSNALMVFSMNAVPRLSDTTDGVFRRLAFIPFRSRFSPGIPGYDPNIAKTLARKDVMERGALLGLMALRPLIERGSLTPIPDMVAEVEEVRQSNDSVSRWIFEECVTACQLDGRPTSSVYNEYAEWCKSSGERNPCSMRTFVTRVCETPASSLTVADGQSELLPCVAITVKQKKHAGKNLRTFVLE